MDVLKTKAGAGGRPAFDCNNDTRNTTPHRQARQPRGAAATYAGTVLRAARNIVERVNRHGPGPGIKRASASLREALDSLDWVSEYAEHEARP